MSNFTITSHKDNSIFFEGDFQSFQECLECAIAQGTILHNADLRGKNLSNSNLDDAKLHGADFTNSNLNGANLSESDLSGCNFTNATLLNTCLAYSDLRDSRFEGAQFGASDVVGADLSRCLFSGLSCFTLGFFDTGAMTGSQYRNIDGHIFAMSQPPVVITGLHSAPIVCMDNNVKLGTLTEKI